MVRSATANGQATYLPTQKVMAGGVAGAFSIVLVFGLNTYLLQPNSLPPIPSEVASAITTVFSFIVAYIMPHGANESLTH